jgi:adenylate cyclase
MQTETERKYLVSSVNFKEEAFRKSRIRQGYLSSVPERTVRVRIKDETSFITIKGKSDKMGLSRLEWEIEIPLEDGEALLNLCEPGLIDKIRYEIKKGTLIFEVDEFLGENLGLIVAEIELESENQDFEKPVWLGDEVTGDIRYFNSNLARNPYTK